MDKPYLKAICDSLNNSKKAIWTIYIYDNRDKTKFARRLRSAGFKGKIKFISCKKDMNLNDLPLKNCIPMLLKMIDLSCSFDYNKNKVKKLYRRFANELQDFLYNYLRNNRKKENALPAITQISVLALPVMAMMFTLISNVQVIVGPSAKMQYHEFIKENRASTLIEDSLSDSKQFFSESFVTVAVLLGIVLLSFFFELVIVVIRNKNSEKMKVLSEIITMLHDE